MIEVKAEKVQRREMMEFIYSKVTAGAIPRLSDNFDLYKIASWNNILAAGKASVKFDSKSCASVKELQEIMLRGKIYRNYKGVHLKMQQLIVRSGTYCLF